RHSSKNAAYLRPAGDGMGGGNGDRRWAAFGDLSGLESGVHRSRVGVAPMTPELLMPVAGEQPEPAGKLLHIIAASWRSLWRFPLRSGLAVLSVVLGVGGVMCAGNYAAEGRLKVLNQVRSLGVNTLVVTPQQSRNVGARAKTGSTVTTLV